MSMSNEDRATIDQLFGRLADTERRSPPRDAEAEAFIRDHVGRQPGAPYFMAQTIVMQDYALKEAERRIADLEATPDRAASELETTARALREALDALA